MGPFLAGAVSLAALTARISGIESVATLMAVWSRICEWNHNGV
jgi:hypothetical protein